MSIDLKDRDKMDVLLKILELNENHVEWIKDMDYKVTYYTFVFLIALVQRGGKEYPFRSSFRPKNQTANGQLTSAVLY